MKLENYKWYALIINPLKSRLAQDSIRLLKHKGIKSMLTVTEMHTGLKMKSKMLFIEINLTDDLKRRILNIQNVYKFFPSSESPCEIKDIENFLPENKNAVVEKLLDDANESIKDLEKEDKVVVNSEKKVKKVELIDENVEFEKGNYIQVVSGPMSGVQALIIDLDQEKDLLVVEINFANTSAVAEINKTDAKLIK